MLSRHPFQLTKNFEKSFDIFWTFYIKSQGFLYEWKNDITILKIYHAYNLTQSSYSVGSSLVDPWAK